MSERALETEAGDKVGAPVHPHKDRQPLVMLPANQTYR